MAVKDYIRQRFFPHLWCAGCGHGIVMKAILRAINKLGHLLGKQTIAEFVETTDVADELRKMGVDHIVAH